MPNFIKLVIFIFLFMLMAGWGLAAFYLRRQDVGFNDVDSMLENPIFHGKTVSELKSFLGTSTKYCRFSANVELQSLEMDMYSILERAGQRVGTLSRASIPL